MPTKPEKQTSLINTPQLKSITASGYSVVVSSVLVMYLLEFLASYLPLILHSTSGKHSKKKICPHKNGSIGMAVVWFTVPTLLYVPMQTDRQ